VHMRLNSRYWDQIMAAHGAEHKAAQERIEELREQLEKARQENPRLAEFVPDGDYWEPRAFACRSKATRSRTLKSCQ
jgi:hypothetical protein